MSELFSTSLAEFSFFTPNSLRRKIVWFIKLRWIAALGAFIYAPILSRSFEEHIQFIPLFICAILLVVVNLIYIFYTRSTPPTTIDIEERLLFVQIFADMAILTAILHFSGGVENPLFFFFIFYIIITSIITDRRTFPFIVAGIDCILFTTMALGEQFGFLKHFHLVPISHEPAIMVFSLITFYITVFASAYISVSLISRHRKVKHLILEQNRLLEASGDEKSKFFRFVSHELKSPIVAIESYANVIIDILPEKVDKQVLDLIIRIKTRTQQMISMIKDLLDISYTDSTQKDPELVNPCEFLQLFIEDEKPMLESKSIHLSVDICSKKGTLLLDKFKLEKIFTNLLGNAIRYTPDGGQVSIRTNIQGSQWILTISDTGIGIPDSDLKNIFEEFYRGENAKKHVSIGTGLGMNIVKKFVEEIDGTISIDSHVNEGTTVTIKVPIHD